MDCTLATLIACFSWSGIYIDTGLGHQDSDSYRVDSYAYEFQNVLPGVIETGGFNTQTSSELDSYDFGRFGIGYEMNLSNVRLSLNGSVTKNLNSGRNVDVKAITLNARWFLFR